MRPLNVLMVEDSEDDALLVLRALTRGGLEVTATRVDTAAALEAALEREPWDIVISDYNLPGFSGTDALAMVKKKGLDVPFIIVSGVIGEETAVEAMRAGAHDYLKKDNLARLSPAVERELAEARVRKEHRQAEEALRLSEERYRIIAETASDAIVTIDEENAIVFANAAIEKIFGYRQDEVAGRPITMLMPERFREAHLSGVKRYVATGKRRISWQARELVGLHKSGHEIPLEISYGDFIKDGRHFFIGIIRDITERKEAEKETEYKHALERFTQELETLVTERTMGLLALTLADRVRNPASVIRLTCRRLLERREPPEKQREGIEVIGEEADRLDAIVKDFQSLLKSKKSMFQYEDLNEIVSGILTVIRDDTVNKRVKLVTRLAKRPLKMNVQKDLMRVAVFHLLRNAVEATPEGGTITVITCGNRSSVTLSVSDTGPGIPGEIIEQVFDPFFSTKEYRFGMGLPLVKQIVSEHMGEITAKSKTGKGTTFAARFPARWTEKPLRDSP